MVIPMFIFKSIWNTLMTYLMTHVDGWSNEIRISSKRWSKFMSKIFHKLEFINKIFQIIISDVHSHIILYIVKVKFSVDKNSSKS